MEIESTSTAQTASPTRKASWCDRVATGLMLMSAVGAFVSFISAIGDSVNAGPATQVVEIWRMYGFCVFGGLFLLLAIFPRRYPGIWELVILDKAALAVTGLVLLGHGVKDALTILIADGTLALVIVLAYILTRGYSSWGMLRTSESK